MDKRLITIILLALNFVSLFSFAQKENETITEDVKIFKEKLQEYYEKREILKESPIIRKSIDTSIYNMPTGDIRLFMIDEELGLAIEYSTKKIYDQETRLFYEIDTEKIYDPKTNSYYEFMINPLQ